MLVPEATTHDAVLQTVKQAKAANLESVELFDVFRGKNVPEGQKSLAYAFIYRAAEKTLTDAEVNAAHAKIVEAFKSQLCARSLRGNDLAYSAKMAASDNPACRRRRGTVPLRLLNHAVRADDMDAGINQILFDGRHGLREAVQRGVNLAHAALFARQQARRHRPARADTAHRGKCFFNLAGSLLPTYASADSTTTQSGTSGLMV